MVHEWGTSWDGEVLSNDVVGSLRWDGVSLKDTVPLPATSSHIWLAPRGVRSSGVLASSGEGERYLFYRGVAHLDAVVQTELLPGAVRLRAPHHLEWLGDPAMTLAHLWLVDIRSDGSLAFREREGIRIPRDDASRELGSIPLFSSEDYTAGGLTALRSSMKRTLLSRGLFEDEADAMLNTWQESYYRTPGLRIFYVVPDQWLAYFLPLETSAPHQLTRVLIGRIDLERS